jgi:hypothetical protein
MGDMSIVSMNKDTAMRPREDATETPSPVQISTSVRIDDTTEIPPKSMSIRIGNATPNTGNTVQYPVYSMHLLVSQWYVTLV